jgi:tRNA pseudouridine55 synthase
MAGDQLTHGVLAVNKPADRSSHDVVQHVRRLLKQRSIGHTGTLDLLAEGVLVLCLGRATKIARFLSDFDKEYEATITLGLTSETFDREGIRPDMTPADPPEITDTELDRILDDFRGTITQTVPPYSAVRVDGERLYRISRRGEIADLPSREISIHELHLIERSRATIRLRVVCSKGTYIRSLAHDLGQRLGCGAYLSALRRTAVGPFRIERAHSLAILEQAVRDGRFADLLTSLEQALPFGAIRVKDEFSERVLTGTVPRPADVADVEGPFGPGDRVMLKDNRGAALAVATARCASDNLAADKDAGLIDYIRVLQ